MVIINWVLENKEWIFSGVGLLILGSLLNFFSKKEKDVTNDNKNINTNNNQKVVVNNFLNKKEEVIKKYDRNIPHNKDDVKILFIDDDTTFKIIDILKNSGWKNTSIVNDVTDIDSLEVKNTHIFFIDIKGVAVWLSKKHQGLALAEKIKDKYPHKIVVIYSSDTKGDRSHGALQKTDWFLPKDAEPADFFSVIEKFTSPQ